MSDEPFTPAQVAQLTLIIKESVHEAFADIGLKVDDEHKEDTREVVSFLRKLKRVWDGAVGKIGNAVLIALIAVVFGIFGMGFWQWINRGGH
jgi:hypothetical protein